MRARPAGPVLLASALAGLSLLAAACLQQESIETEDIVSAVPWPDQERAEYVLLDRDTEEEQGTGVLSVSREDGEYELRLRFENESAVDESVAIVDAATLKPASIRREISTEDKTVTGEYDADEGVVRIEEIEGDGEPRELPLRLEDNYYNNEEAVFLWRAIPFEEEYEASYYSVLTNRRTQILVTVRVAGKEALTVPAGTFDAWRVEIEFGDVKQVAWYADTPERPLVQYDNSRQLFQLTAIE